MSVPVRIRARSGSAGPASTIAAPAGVAGTDRLRLAAEAPVAPAPQRVLAEPGGATPSIGDDILRRIDATIAAAGVLGIDTTAAEAVRDEAHERLAHVADAYVLALVGGTGVGKSTLLNALAGREVSAAGVRRPTTAEPVAWVARDAEAGVRPLLDWLGVTRIELHDEPSQRGVVLLDLPDVDSRSEEHRRRVDALLPRLDAVAWVTDPEKYADAILHDELLGQWLPRLDRQVVVLNKVDRLDARSRVRVATDLERRLAPLRRGGRVRVLSTAAQGGRDGIAGLDGWLRDGVDAKRVVLGRLRVAATQVVGELAAAAGVDTDGAPRLIVDVAARRATLADVETEVLRMVDLPGARRQAVAATRARARRRGTGPLGIVTSAVDRASGRQARTADPAGYLGRWKERGPVARATEPVRQRLGTAIAGVPPGLRPRIAAAADQQALGARLARAVDAALPRPGALEVPRSALWPLLGLLQTASLAVTILAVAWMVTWFIFRPPVDVVTVPVVGTVPVPLALLAASLAVGYVLARAVGWHAGWRGRRWAAAVERDVRRAVAAAVDREAFAALDAVEAARRQVWQAARGRLDTRPG